MRRLILPFVLFVAGCAPEIGDACDTSTDCSQSGERLCDVSQQGGYCTVFDCEKGMCPEEATCVVFAASPSRVDACIQETGTSPSQRSFCMLACEVHSDCRVEDGYGCLDPTVAGGESVDEPGRRVCMFNPVASTEKPNHSGEVCTGASGAEG